LSILLLFGVFDSFLFPGAIIFERQSNPAYLHDSRFEVVFASETKFGLSELRTFSIYSQIDRCSIKAASFGNSLYRENFFEAGFGFPAGKGFAFGINVAGLNCWIRDVSNEFTGALKVGGQFEKEPVLVSAWVSNINVPRLSAVDYVPICYSLSCDYRGHANLHFNFTLRGVEKGLPFYNVGLKYQPYRILTLGAGVNTKPLLLEYGLKLSLGKLCLSYSGNRHQQLGLTHNIVLGFRQ
jgi:hypothetical protein